MAQFYSAFDTPVRHCVQVARRERREARFQEVKRLRNESVSGREIARRLGLSRNTVGKMAGIETLLRSAARSRGGSKVAPFVAELRSQWQSGCRNATQLHQTIAGLGFKGSVNIVQRVVRSWRDKPRGRVMPAEPKTPSPRRCAWFLTNRTHPSVTEEEQAAIKRLTGSVPEIGEAERLSVSFAAMLRERRGSEFAA